MAEKLDPEELVSFKEILMANSIQVDTLSQLLIEKDIIMKEEFFASKNNSVKFLSCSKARYFKSLITIGAIRKDTCFLSILALTITFID